MELLGLNRESAQSAGFAMVDYQEQPKFEAINSTSFLTAANESIPLPYVSPYDPIGLVINNK